MKSAFYHLQINICFEFLDFYKLLFERLGWSAIFETENVVGFTSGQNGDIWFVDTTENGTADYDQRGVNHISIKVEKAKHVDEIVTFLESQKVKPLFDTPRHRPEFARDASQTYYQVMFKTVDNILFEIVYVENKEK